MPDYEKLLQSNLPETFEKALAEIDRAYEIPKQLLQADISSFEALECCVFAYFARDDVFYLNKCGRDLLRLKRPALDKEVASAPAIFWLEDDCALQRTDDYVYSRQQPIFETRELITLSWGKTWLHGSKFPIRSLQGQTLAIIFAGHEITPSQQIKLVADHYQQAKHGTGEN